MALKAILNRVIPYDEEKIGNLYDLYDSSYNKDDFICDGDRKLIIVKMFYYATPITYKKIDKKSSSKNAKTILHKK